MSKEINNPPAVKEAFTKQFPNASNVKWSLESEDEYEAEYTIGETEQATNFDRDGKWLVTETKISQSNLPDTVQTVLASVYIDYSIKTIEKVEELEKVIYYEVKLEKGEIIVTVEISAEGVILKKDEKKEEDEDDEHEDEDEEDEN